MNLDLENFSQSLLKISSEESEMETDFGLKIKKMGKNVKREVYRNIFMNIFVHPGILTAIC